MKFKKNNVIMQTNQMNVKIHKFDPRTIREYASILFAGGRRTGKSFVMRDFLWFLRHKIYDAIIFSGTIDEDHPWERYTPQRLVHPCLEEFPIEITKKAIKNQERRKVLAKKYNAKCPPSVMVFEDVEHLQPPIWNNQSMRSLVFNGRWSKEYCFVAFQYIMEVKMSMRGSFDYAVFAMENSPAVRERIWKQFGGIFPTFAEFESVFFECTKNFRVMVIDCRARSYNLEDCVFWYKAKDRGTFKLGHPDVWSQKVDNSSEDSDAEKKRHKALYGRTRSGRGAAAAANMKIELEDDSDEKKVVRGNKHRHEKNI